MKKCKCGSTNMYYVKEKPTSRCKKCTLAYKRSYNARPEVVARMASVARQKNSGISDEEFCRRMIEQRGLCAACGRPETRQYRGKTTLLSVDHCHDTGQIRGLLCSTCNLAIGYAKNSPSLLRALARYLERNSA